MKVILIIRDGWGYSNETKGNAVFLANTSNNDSYMEEYPWTLLKCTGNAIGVPEGTQGGSEPGHLTIGAGRIVWQPLEEINRSIENCSFYKNKSLIAAVEECKQKKSKLHLMGLFSDQGIHGTVKHLYALLELARINKLDKVYIHSFLDGRDVPERSAIQFIKDTQLQIREKRTGQIASIVGRYYAMDRDNNWQRTEKAYNLLTEGLGFKQLDPIKAIEHYYTISDLSDYYMEPSLICNQDGSPIAIIENNDSVIFWNFRSDRARQLTYAFTQEDFNEFTRKRRPQVHFVCMSVYDKKLILPVAFPQKTVEKNLGEVLSESGFRQLRIAETEKYAHVTFFFNSQNEEPYPREDRILIPSPKVPSYEDKPEMSAPEITNALISQIKRGIYDFILVNYANGDLVGHSANLEAGIKAAATVDECLGKVVEVALNAEYTVLVTGDHGNIETMFYPDGSPNPSHGLNPVPFILITPKKYGKYKLKQGLGLSSIAPTILEIMRIQKPVQMTSESLLE